jgi:glutamyl-tRNA synthetase
MAYREQGILPEALLNYLVRLGWSHGDQEIFSLDELIELFDIRDVNKAASSFNTDKLLWLNQHYIKHDDPARIAHLLSYHLGNLGIDPATGPDLVEVVKAQQERAQSLVEMAQISAFFYKDFDEYDDKAAKKHLRPVAQTPLETVKRALAALDAWTPEAIHEAVDQVAAELDVKMGKVAQPLRVAVAGRAASPGIDVTLYLTGREATLRRIDRALDYIAQRAASSE